MSILNILAILGVVVGIISLIGEIRYKGKRSFAMAVLLIIASAGLYFLAEFAEGVHMLAGVSAQAELDAAAQRAAVDAVDDAPAADKRESDEIDAGTEHAADAEKPADDGRNDGKVKKTADAEKPVKAAPEDRADPSKPVMHVPVPGQKPVFENDPKAPLIHIGSDVDDGKLNEVIAFSAHRTKQNPDGAEIASYKWDFADGTKGEGEKVKHSYDKVGIYDVILTVTDKKGKSAKAVQRIEINRPESKQRFVSRNLDNIANAAVSPEIVTGTFTKKFTGSHVYLEAKGYMLSAEGCTCELAVSLKGGNCVTRKAKKLSDGGEGTLKVKTVCKADPGEVTWTLERKADGKCGCTWNDVNIVGSEG